MKKEYTCDHLGDDNKRDCGAEAEYRCRCCGSPTCTEHMGTRCPYGGEGYIEIE